MEVLRGGRGRSWIRRNRRRSWWKEGAEKFVEGWWRVGHGGKRRKRTKENKELKGGG